MEIRTRDLILRTVGPGDIDETARMWDFEHGDIPRDEALRVLERMEENHSRNVPGRIWHLCLAVTERDEPGKIIGWCGLDGTSGEELHIFYSIGRDYRGQGYATQAARAILDYGFRTAGVPYVNGGCHRDNIASYRVMEKAGMRRAGQQENGDPIFYLSKETYLNDIEIAGASGLQDLPG
ncbi:GNAT family N-acetyltransferase [Acutalibacter muris]|uniref:N-acetyltransferase n=1 Tax=Acutalibacter muris TaxID=1796620 RepID=A0A1Z2XTV4_9FIRM|nr:GNAT family N-acetyltransferase [Acutalibacter muris]ANU54950.1 N-acetyltransferase [Hungateiclostridiaceae bacterium KB18]ASB41821.1 N-acetyltransferase [Acutalibacter muris]QQR31088.1 GNAT family N-acetyltransferase [Acutalibacter muris]